MSEIIVLSPCYKDFFKRGELSTLYLGFFPVFWEHYPYPRNWEFQWGFVKNWEKYMSEISQFYEHKESLSRMTVIIFHHSYTETVK